MGEEELKKVESEEVPETVVEPTPTPVAETATPPPPPASTEAPPPAVESTMKDVAEEKAIIPSTPIAEDKVDDSKALAVVDKVPDSTEEKKSGGSHDRDVALSRLETEKKLSLVRAWEDSEKTKAENKAERALSKITSWENTKKANVEAQLKKIEEQLEKKKADYIEKMKNKIALLHKEADEKRAIVIAHKGEELLKAEETAAKHRATNSTPKKLYGCFGK
ncbi:hypothetical protein AQUCO_01300355v1 [Aquilegia coerulea]|uniref:Remorin C-terminal domain-containing protein n=1 Tax=Aquilegia coerulea TaxID=218851 RepID=A0A2G5E147_AQUCA|nr:hypothetical protein AQUCO_01300355v1 [Aquilegia coerulea]